MSSVRRRDDGDDIAQPTDFFKSVDNVMLDLVPKLFYN